MVYVAKIVLILSGLCVAWAGGAKWRHAVSPEGSEGGVSAALALVLLMVGAFL